MQYMIMLYGSQQDYDVMAGRPSGGKPAMTSEQLAALHAQMGKIHDELADSGELVGGQGLTAPVHARRVRLRGGTPVVTDGPYPESEEVLAGWTIVDCASFDRATEIAARFVDPGTPGGYVDVRPILEDVAELER